MQVKSAARWGSGLVVAGGCVAAVVLVAPADWADNVLNLQVHTFQDSRGVTVLAPVAGLDKDFTERSGLKAKFGVDAITAASDSCARCHPEGANNHRTYTDVSYRRKIGDYTLNVGGEVSRESFYAADTAMTSISRDFNKGATTVAGGYSFSLNRPELHPTREVRNQYSQDAYASITQVLTRSTVVQLSYDLTRVTGYQANPFLRARVNDLLLVGNAPDLRTRHALAVRLRQALPARTYLEADYRWYSDNWAVHANTLSLGLSHYFRPSLLAGVSYRYYDQTGAFFYQPQYLGQPDLFTADFRLAPFTSGLYGGRVVYTPPDGLLGVLPDHTGIEIRYQRYMASSDFRAAIVSVGLRVPLK